MTSWSSCSLSRAPAAPLLADRSDRLGSARRLGRVPSALLWPFTWALGAGCSDARDAMEMQESSVSEGGSSAPAVPYDSGGVPTDGVSLRIDRLQRHGVVRADPEAV